MTDDLKFGEAESAVVQTLVDDLEDLIQDAGITIPTGMGSYLLGGNVKVVVVDDLLVFIDRIRREMP